MKVLALCDSPTTRPKEAMTGFGRVAKNLFAEWTAAGAEIDIWAINFDGWGYKDVPWKLFPAGADWNAPRQLSHFLQTLVNGKYTHVWMLMDSDALCIGDYPNSFPTKLRAACDKYKIRSMLYFPVDAAQQPEWLEIISAVDVAVTYTQYGVREVMAAKGDWEELRQKRDTTISIFPPFPEVKVLPHGLDAHYKSPGTPRKEIRDQIQIGDRLFLDEGDFLMLNVNTNSYRKDPLRTLEILKGLRNCDVPAKLILRMTPQSGVGGINLERAATQLGLTLDKEWTWLPAQPEENMPELYHAADLYLTTTLGEGWGLGITEALGCGCPVALPDNTACEEIGLRVLGTDHANIIFLESEPGYITSNDTRLRRRVDLVKAIAKIEKFYQSGDWKRRVMLSKQTREWLSWPRIAGEMFKLLKGEA